MFSLAILVLFFLSGAEVFAAGEDKDERPNLVVIFTDDLNNLINDSQYAKVRKRLESDLAAWMQSIGDRQAPFGFSNFPILADIFEVMGRQAFPMKPKNSAEGDPWVWYAPALATNPTISFSDNAFFMDKGEVRKIELTVLQGEICGDFSLKYWNSEGAKSFKIDSKLLNPVGMTQTIFP